MNTSSYILDVNLLYLIDPIDGLWGLWQAEVLFEDGRLTQGTIQSDGCSWDEETFEAEDDDDPI